VAFEIGWIAFAINRPLVLPDEPREAAITLEMARSGSWAVPTLNGSPFVEKPPLVYVASAFASRLAGSDAVGVLRLPQALATLASLTAVFALGRRFGGAAAGFTCALLLVTSLEFLLTSVRLVVDPVLVAWTSGAGLSTVEWWLAERRAARIGWWAGISGFLALGVATKGPVVLLFHGSAALGLLLFGGTPALRRLLWLLPSYLLSLAPHGAWALVLSNRGGEELVSEALWRNSWGRFTRAELGHEAPVWFYAKVLPIVLAPWTLLAFAGALNAGSGARESYPATSRATVLRVALGWALVSLLALSLSSAKRELYLLPSLPAWALLAGATLERVRERERLEGLARGALLATLAGFSVACMVGGALLPLRGRLEGLLLLPLALLFAALLGVGRTRWPGWAHALLFGAVALAAASVAPWLVDRAAARGSIEQARTALAHAGIGIDVVYGLGLRERDKSVLSLALGRNFSELTDPAALGSANAPLAPRTLVVSAGGPAVLGSEVRSQCSVEGSGSAPLGSQRLFFTTLVKRE